MRGNRKEAGMRLAGFEHKRKSRTIWEWRMPPGWGCVKATVFKVGVMTGWLATVETADGEVSTPMGHQFYFRFHLIRYLARHFGPERS